MGRTSWLIGLFVANADLAQSVLIKFKTWTIHDFLTCGIEVANNSEFWVRTSDSN